MDRDYFSRECISSFPAAAGAEGPVVGGGGGQPSLSGTTPAGSEQGDGGQQSAGAAGEGLRDGAQGVLQRKYCCFLIAPKERLDKTRENDEIKERLTKKVPAQIFPSILFIPKSTHPYPAEEMDLLANKGLADENMRKEIVGVHGGVVQVWKIIQAGGENGRRLHDALKERIGLDGFDWTDLWGKITPGKTWRKSRKKEKVRGGKGEIEKSLQRLLLFSSIFSWTSIDAIKAIFLFR